jgi:glutamine amidotransferase
MCRLLAVHDSRAFDIGSHLRQLAAIARNSSEYQGDGWGCASYQDQHWRIYKRIQPIWEDDLNQFGRTTLLLAHARSAFRNEGLDVENNMPFIANSEAFIFNGELHGVKINACGRIGAEKLFHFLRRFDGHDQAKVLRKVLGIVKKRSRYIRAMNFVLAGRHALYSHSYFNEAKEYFTLHKKQDGTQYRICSEPYRTESGWIPLPNDCLEVHPF